MYKLCTIVCQKKIIIGVYVFTDVTPCLFDSCTYSSVFVAITKDICSNKLFEKIFGERTVHVCKAVSTILIKHTNVHNRLHRN